MQRLIGAGAALLLMVGANTAWSAQVTPRAASGTAIVPGFAVGSFHLGGDVADAVATLGPLYAHEDVPKSTTADYYWPLRRLGATVDASTKKIVALVVSLDDGYRTDKGVGAGSDSSAVRAAYGAEDSVDSTEDDETLVYDRFGVAFVVDKTGALSNRVSVVFVFAPGQYATTFLRAPSQ